MLWIFIILSHSRQKNYFRCVLGGSQNGSNRKKWANLKMVKNWVLEKIEFSEKRNTYLSLAHDELTVKISWKSDENWEQESVFKFPQSKKNIIAKSGISLFDLQLWPWTQTISFPCIFMIRDQTMIVCESNVCGNNVKFFILCEIDMGEPSKGLVRLWPHRHNLKVGSLNNYIGPHAVAALSWCAQ